MTEEERIQSPEPSGEGNDASLQSAMENLGEASPDQAPEPVAAPVVDEEHSEKSKLGRKLKRVEDDLNNFRGTLSRIEMMLASREPSAAPEPEERPPDLPQTVYTPEDVIKVVDFHEQTRARKIEQQRTAYEKAYVRGVLQLRGNDPAFDEVAKELLQEGVEHYAAHTGNPLKDAQINYRLAKANLIEKKVNNAPKPNVRGEQSLPTGVSVTQRQTPAAAKSVELDPFAKKFVQGLGLSDNDEWVQGVLKREK